MAMFYGLLVQKGQRMTDSAYDASFWQEFTAAIRQHVAKAVESATRPLQDEIKSLKEARIHYRGDFETEQSYAQGDCVRSSGSIWRALCATTDRPPGVTWQLLLRRARDGKDGKDGRDAAA
jgi:hypothetical protein